MKQEDINFIFKLLDSIGLEEVECERHCNLNSDNLDKRIASCTCGNESWNEAMAITHGGVNRVKRELLNKYGK